MNEPPTIIGGSVNEIGISLGKSRAPRTGGDTRRHSTRGPVPASGWGSSQPPDAIACIVVKGPYQPQPVLLPQLEQV